MNPVQLKYALRESVFIYVSLMQSFFGCSPTDVFMNLEETADLTPNRLHSLQPYLHEQLFS